MRIISIVTPCFNEEENIEEVYLQVRNVFAKLPEYNLEHIFIDNASVDKTVSILKQIAEKDKKVKIIVNTRNFGRIRSSFYGLLQTNGDAAVFLASDLQNPPELIPDFIKKWEAGYKVVVAVKKNSNDSLIISFLKGLYYKLLKKMADLSLIRNFDSFGLYDREIIRILKRINDPYPYFKGLICEIGFERAEIEYLQPKREKGKSKNGFYNLFDTAILEITSYSQVPLRIATLLGFLLSFLSILTAFFYFVYKLVFWSSFSIGIAPLVIGVFFFSSVQIFFIGVVGEYLGLTYTQILKRPLVIEKERINFAEEK